MSWLTEWVILERELTHAAHLFALSGVLPLSTFRNPASHNELIRTRSSMHRDKPETEERNPYTVLFLKNHACKIALMHLVSKGSSVLWTQFTEVSAWHSDRIFKKSENKRGWKEGGSRTGEHINALRSRQMF